MNLHAYGLTLVVSIAVAAAAADLADEESEDCPEALASLSLFQKQWAVQGTAAKHKVLNWRQSSYGGFADIAPEFFSGPSKEASMLHIASKWNITDWSREYTRKWCSADEDRVGVVKLNATALAQIGIVTEKPLVVDFQPVQVQLDIDSPPLVNMTHPLLCAVFHRSGSEFCAEFLTSYAQVIGEPNRWQSDSMLNTYDCQYSDCNDLDDWVIPEGGIYGQLENLGNVPFRMLNWIREPDSLILSAFRYHMQTPECWGYKLGFCMGCDKHLGDHDAMFGVCDQQCTYTQLLTSLATVNETAGVIVEALNERSNIREMLDVAANYANDPQVLHLSVEHLKKDFNQTIRCINTFLGGKGLAPEQLDIFQSLNMDTDSSDKNNASRYAHVTTGKYNNTALKQFLHAFPMWAQDFANVKSFLYKIFQRQTVKYGCPMP